MSERDSYAEGEFCWVDLAVPDIDAAVAFYGDLLGWEFQPAGTVEETGGYGNILYQGKYVAGIGPIMGEGQPPAWSSYVNVADADATAAKVTGAGGALIVEPMDIPNGAGRMAVCHDAEGAVFSLWQPGEHKGAQLVNEVGTWTWNNLVTRDLDKAKGFYGEVFGWTAEVAAQAPPDSPYQMWQVAGQRWEEGLAGLSTADSDLSAGVPPHWQVYFAVASADEAIEKTKAAGGQNLFGPQRIPVGTLAILLDPQGAGFAIIEPDYPEAR